MKFAPRIIEIGTQASLLAVDLQQRDVLIIDDYLLNVQEKMIQLERTQRQLKESVDTKISHLGRQLQEFVDTKISHLERQLQESMEANKQLRSSIEELLKNKPQ